MDFVKNIKLIEVNDWDKLVEKTYGKPYNFQQQNGCQGRGIVKLTVPDKWAKCEDDEMYDSIPEVINGDKMGVKFQVWLDRDPKLPLNPTDEELKNNGYYWGKTKDDEEKYKNDKGHISMFWERNFYPNVIVIANDLHEKGILESGEYIININW